MAHNIILVRHGEQLDAEHGVIDGPLSPRGIAQAEAVGRRL
ncbi:MAG: histidine phosphatase family protein, partial [Aurantimicrobium sp.]